MKKHPNRKYHNWIIYRIGDRFLNNNINLFHGVLYDLGCGESPYKDFFTKYVEKYVGVDWSDSFHDIKADVVSNLNRPLPIESEVADSIVSLSVLEHLNEPQTMLNEAYRILKPGGNILLQVPWQHQIHEEPYDFFRYTPYGLKYMFEKSGFYNVEVIPSSGFFTMMVLKNNYFLTRIIRKKIVQKIPILKIILGLFLVPIWFVSQLIAPILDKFDKKLGRRINGLLCYC